MIVRVFVALLLVIEAGSTCLWIAGLLPAIAAYDGLAITMIGLRGLVGAAQLVAASLLLRRAALGRPFAQMAIASSAVLFVFEIGLGFAPSNLFPAFRWLAVAVYSAYAAAMLATVRTVRR